LARLHTDRAYEAELAELRSQILLLGAKVEEIVECSMRALVERDTALAQRMLDYDRQINRLELEVDDLCLRILARRHPVASDLRFITTALKLVVDLERIGDLGVNLCERVIELNTEPPLRPYDDLRNLAATALGMVRDALDAFVADDRERAQQVISRDPAVDAAYTQIFRELLTYMMENPRNIFRATRIQSVAKYIERIADHATNLSEMVVFMVGGEDIRHRWSEDSRPELTPPQAVVFLGARNSARSQMAEAFARRALPRTIACYSAGSRPAGEVHPLTVRVMREVGIELDGHRPKPLATIPADHADLVVAVCAEELFVKHRREQRVERWNLDDPSTTAPEDRQLATFRDVRDEIRRRIDDLARRL